jgi:hypothetical protein
MSERKTIRYADVVATLALLVASGGTAYAAVALPRNSVDTPQLRAGAVTAPKLHRNAVTGPRIKANAVTGAKILDASIAGVDLAEGSVGPTQLADGSVSTVKIGAGQITEGHFAPGVVRSVAVADESLSVVDIAGAQALVTPAGFTLAGGECANFSSINAPGAQPGQTAFAGWVEDPPAGMVITRVFITAPNQAAFSICNATNGNVSFPASDLRIVTFG